ncbi:plasmid recombination protein [Candidatus Nitrotoga sp. AM1P]|uniref:plasmid recombination protein n=1 Tax=Candidatus Nitrotoga sp. AM1P TaxID=2559597 RepID=UPI0010AFFA9F|nr:plasmid recombination protein [Candidatus Nitrotoga sp. AM1P]BBJ24583.1 hypothetical protein W01_25100 [Candidatus Nitrotoga sp. AM1P]
MIEHSQMLRIKKLKGVGIIATAARHNLREIQAERGAGSNIDPFRTKLNYVIQGANSASDVASLAQALMDDAGVKPLRKDAVRCLEIIFSLPPQSVIEQSVFFPDCVAWAKRYFQVPILSATVHLDESAPHCHVLLLPLVNARMIGSGLFGNRATLQALHAAFHVQVGQVHGLARQATPKRHSAVVRREAADMVMTALKVNQCGLNDSVMGLLRDCIAYNPEPLLQALKLTMPRKQSKHKTFAAIMTQSKPEKPIGFNMKKPIGFDAVISDEKKQSLSCVGFGKSIQLISPAEPLHSSYQDRYIRERESEQAADYWDEVQGEFIKLPAKQKMKSAEIERVREAIQGTRLPGRAAGTSSINKS